MTDAGVLQLDTSFLIHAMAPTSQEARALSVWLAQKRRVAMSTLAWGEFLCGPLSEEAVSLARLVVRAQVALGADEAVEGARLFNATGRRRGSFQDCLIAATAIKSAVPLATADHADFRRFQSLGLGIEDIEGTSLAEV